ncbi:hypothetical protein [Paenibacillus macerans]|uniref:hypothetical protein n=1 Tax=Paenibacillus macerans TaxID=44252 RepID=UPI00203D8391|nr:hypothetical protein [Paenibacillus macerans]MCM3703362.1 hypothetical protein [Paenibacillus macerans]
MAKTDWKNSDIVKPDDMNQIGQEINHLYTEIEERLDTVKSSDMTLQPGLQVITAAKDARFRLGEVRGRTLINLLGSAGSFDSLTGWSVVGTAAIDTTNKVEGSGCAAITVTNGQYADIFQRFSYNPSKNYIAVARVKMVSGVAMALRMNDNAVPKEMKSPLMSTLNKFETVFIRVPANFFTGANIVYISALLSGPNDSSGYVDALRVYEISDAEYAALDGMTPEQVAAKYPFVHAGIRGVDGPYAITKSENLLPPFYEYVEGLGINDIGPYEASITLTQAYQSSYVDVPALPNTTYVLSCESFSGPEAFINASEFQGNTDLSLPHAVTSKSNTTTVTTGANTDRFRVFISANAPGTFTFKNPMLVLSSESKPFQPQRNSMLAFQTELYANPDDGSNPDVLFEQNGQYFKLAKWKKLILDGALSWNVDIPNVTSSYKTVVVRDGTISSPDYVSFVTKYTGALLTNRTTTSYTGPDQSLMYLNGIHVSIANTESGWGPDYTPTQDEIKAYFNGWKMTIQGSSTGAEPYNNTGTKVWVNINSWDGSRYFMEGARGTLPTDISDTAHTPYQLLYRLTKETVEPVVSEGCLTLAEGDNLVEVGTGIVLREGVEPVLGTDGRLFGFNNPAAYPGTNLKFKTNDIRAIYRKDARDFNWFFYKNIDWSMNGGGYADIYTYNYDPSAAYSTTYFKLDKSPVVSITGALAANEKALINDLAAGVAEALQRVSVVEQKKAEKDVPGWITPTLLNGWTSVVSFRYRVVDGHVEFAGSITGGPTGPGVQFFKLIPTARPKIGVQASVAAFNGTGWQIGVISCSPDGIFYIDVPANNKVVFDGVRISLY